MTIGWLLQWNTLALRPFKGTYGYLEQSGKGLGKFRVLSFVSEETLKGYRKEVPYFLLIFF